MIKKVKTKAVKSVFEVELYIEADDPKFVPVCKDEGADLLASIVPDVNGSRRCNVSYRNVYKIYCGFSIKVPKGYKVIIESTEKHAEKGMITYANIVGNDMQKMYVYLTNTGKEIVPLNDGEAVGRMFLVPVFPFKVVKNEIK